MKVTRRTFEGLAKKAIRHRKLKNTQKLMTTNEKCADARENQQVMNTLKSKLAKT
jgi:hypothetical protein